MYQIEKFINLPKHQSLVDRATSVLIGDSRVKAIYLGGSQKADEYSDVDLIIWCDNEEDREGMKKDRLKIAKQVGNIKSESISGFPYVYVVFYEQEEIKVDYCFNILPVENRPDRAHIDILYDPEGLLEKMVKESWELQWEINLDELKNKIQHYYIGISYTVGKILRGELWDAFDCIEFYRKYLIEFEDILAQRKRENYRRVEEKLNQKRLEILNKTIVSELTKTELFRAMDFIFVYFDNFIKERIQVLDIYPDVYSKNMKEYYERQKALVNSN
ncbi:MAG: hypothetical protein V3V41_07730 [Candidatus Heimdallarchaeota archaeon]